MTRALTSMLFAVVAMAGMAALAPQQASARPWGYYRAPYVPYVAAYRYPVYRPYVVAPRVVYRPIVPVGPVVPVAPYGVYPYPYGGFAPVPVPAPYPVYPF